MTHNSSRTRIGISVDLLGLKKMDLESSRVISYRFGCENDSPIPSFTIGLILAGLLLRNQ
jgi:hypothetical protein